MTDEERETRIRYENTMASIGPPGHEEIKILLRRLDEARVLGSAHIAELERELLEARAKISELAVKLNEARRDPDALYDWLGRNGHLVVDTEGHPWTPARPLNRDDAIRLYTLYGRWG
jgi:hypothetical protein